MRRLTFLLLMVIALAATACLPSPDSGEDIVAATATLPPTPIIVTATPLPPTPAPVVEQPQVTFTAYRHRSGVFNISVPDRWEVIDDSTTLRLLVRLIPPQGYGSRALVDATNEGLLAPDAILARANQYIAEHYPAGGGYTEISRGEFVEGRLLQVTFTYDDGLGATGQETLVLEQVGPYFTARRLFISANESAFMGPIMQTVASSFSVDASAVWGTSVAAINPAELRIANTLLWRDRDDNAYYGGELFNASPSPVIDAQVQVSFCDAGGVVVREVTQPVALARIEPGGISPFVAVMAELPDEVSVCAEATHAQPAPADPTYTTALSFNVDEITYHQWRRDLTVIGTVTNHSLSPVEAIRVMVVAYDAEDRVMSVEVGALDVGLRLEPGQSTEFEVVVPVLEEQPDHVVTAVEGDIANLTNPSLAP